MLKFFINLIIFIFVFPIKIYQLLISPFFGPNCRFLPTCSEYSIEAIEKHGILRGIIIAIKRIIKCNPFGASGYDPIPDVE